MKTFFIHFIDTTPFNHSLGISILKGNRENPIYFSSELPNLAKK